MRFFVLFLLLIYGQSEMTQASEGGIDFERNLAALVGAPVAEVQPLVNAYAECVNADPHGPAATFAPLLQQVAGFANTETLRPTQQLLTDFTRQLVVQTTWGTKCQPLADLWQRYDPFVVMSADFGIGLTEADLRGAATLNRLRAELQDTVGPDEDRARLIQFWDSFDGEDQQYNRVFLSRLNAWAAAVETAWPALSHQGRLDATAVTHQDVLPDNDQLMLIVHQSNIIEWMSGYVMMTELSSFAQYQDVIDMARRGTFGGRQFARFVARHNSVKSTAQTLMYTDRAFGMMFDLMDLNAGYP